MSGTEIQPNQIMLTLTDTDLELFQSAAKVAWPSAVMNTAEIVVGLASIAANCMQKPKKTDKS